MNIAPSILFYLHLYYSLMHNLYDTVLKSTTCLLPTYMPSYGRRWHPLAHPLWYSAPNHVLILQVTVIAGTMLVHMAVYQQAANTVVKASACDSPLAKRWFTPELPVFPAAVPGFPPSTAICVYWRAPRPRATQAA